MVRLVWWFGVGGFYLRFAERVRSYILLMMTRLSNVLAILILAGGAVAGIAALAVNEVDSGLTFGTGTDANGREMLVVRDVRDDSIGSVAGAHVGDIVLNIDGTMTRPGDRGAIGANVGASPRATLYLVSPDKLEAALANNDLGSPARLIYIGWATQRLGSSGLALMIGLALCLLALVWARSGGMGKGVRRAAMPLLAAAAVPLLVLPAYLTLSRPAILLSAVLVAGSAADAVHALTVGNGRLQRTMLFAGLAAAVAAAIVGASLAFTLPERGAASELRWLLSAATVLVPGLVGAASLREPNAGSRLSRLSRLTESIELAVAVSFPIFTLAPLGMLTNDAFVAPALGWTVVFAVVAVAVIRPLAIEAKRSAVERALAIRGTEAERARIATEIHDDVLQDLTMVIHSLERSGALEPAGAVRRSVDRLRTIGSDLRLPVLDDLGLVTAIGSLASGHAKRGDLEIRFESRGEARYSRDVETAVFRIAQEAIVNAVKHGRPPVIVRLSCEPARITLEVEDGGSGLSPSSVVTAAAEGHIGLLTMTQRAEEIGAAIDFGPIPSHGSKVTLEWQADAAHRVALPRPAPAR
jgi:signal transduction histidine kinase